MANFFDDEADTHDHQVNPDNTLAGPSRRPARSRSPSEDDDDDDALPPPLAGRTTSYNNNDKGKARAPPAGYTSNAGAGAQRHARGSSSMSIDIDTTSTTRHRNNNSTTTTRQRDRGFLADDDDDDQDNERDDAERLGRDHDELQLDGDGGNNESDIQHLMRLYMDERMAPELLKFPEELITNLMQNLEAQVGFHPFAIRCVFRWDVEADLFFTIHTCSHIMIFHQFSRIFPFSYISNVSIS